MICLPLFAINLLKPADGPSFLQTICVIIVNVLQPSNTNRKEAEYLSLSREVFYLLDAVAYSLPTEYLAQLSNTFRFYVSHSYELVGLLLSHSPQACLRRCSVRTNRRLSWRAPRAPSRTSQLVRGLGQRSIMYAHTLAGPGLFRSLLSFSEDTPEKARDFTKLPQVDRMCALLMDSSRTGATVRLMRTFSLMITHSPYRVTLFALLCSPLSSRSQWRMRTP